MELYCSVNNNFYISKIDLVYHNNLYREIFDDDIDYSRLITL